MVSASLTDNQAQVLRTIANNRYIQEYDWFSIWDIAGASSFTIESLTAAAVCARLSKMGWLERQPAVSIHGVTWRLSPYGRDNIGFFAA